MPADITIAKARQNKLQVGWLNLLGNARQTRMDQNGRRAICASVLVLLGVRPAPLNGRKLGLVHDPICEIELCKLA